MNNVRNAFLTELTQALTDRGRKVERLDNNIVRIDGRYVNLWVMTQVGNKNNPDKLILRIGYKSNVKNIGDADMSKVSTLADGVEQWLADTNPDLDYDLQ